MDMRVRQSDELTLPKRNHFFYGKLLDEMHLRLEQNYFNGKRHLLNRLALGHGVLCGLEVVVEDGTVWVTPGVAIDRHGREIIVPEKVQIDLNPAAPSREVYVVTNRGVYYKADGTTNAPWTVIN